MTVRLIAIDIDGTLLDSSGRLPDANRQAIHAAVTRGVEVVLATGRTFHHARPIAEQLGATVVLIVSNGALVNSCCHMGYPPMIGDSHFHRGYFIRPQKSKSLINYGIIS